MRKKEIVIIGDVFTGKTTLGNALLGWDLFPQSNEGWHVHTLANDSRMLTKKIRLTDTPGYHYLFEEVPKIVEKAVARADTVIVLLSEYMADEDFDIPKEALGWEDDRKAEHAMLSRLFAKAKTRDIYFVIPYDTEEWEGKPVPLSQSLRLAKARFAHMSDHGEDAFFCVDPLMALIAAIEDDHEAQERSGILPLKEALLKTPNKKLLHLR